MVSMELRKLIVTNAKAGMPVKEISQVFRVGKSTIWKLLKRERETGSIEPQYQGRKSAISAEQRQAMLDLVEREPDVTLEEVRERLDLPIHKSQISNLLHQEGYNYKKNGLCPGTETGRCSREAKGLGRTAGEIGQQQMCISGRKWGQC